MSKNGEATNGITWLAPITSLVVAAFGGWYVGLECYRWVLVAVFHQRANDVLAVGFLVSIAVALELIFVYLPLAGWLNGRSESKATRSLAGLMLGAAGAPLGVCLVVLGYGGTFASVVSPEAMLMWVWAAFSSGPLFAVGSFHSKFWANR